MIVTIIFLYLYIFFVWVTLRNSGTRSSIGTVVHVPLNIGTVVSVPLQEQWYAFLYRNSGARSSKYRNSGKPSSIGTVVRVTLQEQWYAFLYIGTYVYYQLSPSLYNPMNERKKKKIHSNEAHLLLCVVIRTIIIKIEKNIYFSYFCYFHFQCFSGTNCQCSVN